MADGSKIEWTEATWNPITGCSVVSPGCTNCYAMRLAGGRMKHHWSRQGLTRDSKAGPVWTGEVRFNEQWLDQPLRWSRPRMIFVCAHSDLFGEAVRDEWIDRVFDIMARCPRHTFQVLTKRAKRMRDYISLRVAAGACNQVGGERVFWPLPNVWPGVSIEDRPRGEERAWHLANTPAALRWWSAEPLLGDLGELTGLCFHDTAADGKRCVDWIVAGGESGPGARPMHPDWARSLRDQCAAAGVPFFFKQWGDWAPERPLNYCQMSKNRWSHQAIAFLPDGTLYDPSKPAMWLSDGLETVYRVGKKAAGALLDGREHRDYPSRG